MLAMNHSGQSASDTRAVAAWLRFCVPRGGCGEESTPRLSTSESAGPGPAAGR